MKPEATMSLAAAASFADFSAMLEQHPLDTAPATTCCQALAGQDLLVLYPDSPEYKQRTESYWSVAAQLTPWCIVQPSTAHEVSTALLALLGADPQCGIAVRSGGYTQYAGAASIAEGVTIDLGNMNSTTHHPESGTASLQPGARWSQVYAALEALGVTVAGGRTGSVGVAGITLGGGISFYSAKKGMICDGVVGFEMVTAAGDIIYASEDTYPDLFKVLKGGSSNFGIVTRFDLEAFEAPKLWGGVVTYNKTAGPELISSMVAFVDNVENDPGSASIVLWTYQPSVKDTIVVGVYENTDGVAAGPSFENYLAVPANLSSTMRVTDISDLTQELEQPTGYIQTWFTLCFQNDPRVYEYAVAAHAQFVEDVLAQSPDGDVVTQCGFQPVPTVFGERGTARRGGNMLGLDRLPGNAVLFLGLLAVRGAAAGQEAAGRARLREYVEGVAEFARSVGAEVEWRFLNYADGEQDPLGSYGPENFELIRAAAEKYDPAGVFQTRVPGGFKFSKSARAK